MPQGWIGKREETHSHWILLRSHWCSHGCEQCFIVQNHSSAMCHYLPHKGKPPIRCKVKFEGDRIHIHLLEKHLMHVFNRFLAILFARTKLVSQSELIKKKWKIWIHLNRTSIGGPCFDHFSLSVSISAFSDSDIEARIFVTAFWCALGQSRSPFCSRGFSSNISCSISSGLSFNITRRKLIFLSTLNTDLFLKGLLFLSHTRTA